MPGGRPTTYNSEVIKKTREYIAQCKDEQKKNKLIVHLPSIAGLAIYLDIGRRTIYDWSEKHEEFAHILEKVLSEQEKRLIENGLSGNYNSNIVKLALGKHGYTDKQDITSGGRPLPLLGGKSNGENNSSDEKAPEAE